MITLDEFATMGLAVGVTEASGIDADCGETVYLEKKHAREMPFLPVCVMIDALRANF